MTSRDHGMTTVMAIRRGFVAEVDDTVANETGRRIQEMSRGETLFQVSPRLSWASESA